MPQIKLAAAPFPDQRLMALSVFQVTRPLFEDLFAQFCTCVLATLGPLPLMLWWSHALVEISMADVYVVALSQSSIATSADPLKGSASLFPFALSASHAVSLYLQRCMLSVSRVFRLCLRVFSVSIPVPPPPGFSVVAPSHPRLQWSTDVEWRDVNAGGSGCRRRSGRTSSLCVTWRPRGGRCHHSRPVVVFRTG